VKTMLMLSLVLNVIVLTPICLGLVADAGWIAEAYGPRAPARDILLSVYLAMFLASAAFLFRPVPSMVAALLLVQIVYKVTTPFTVGTVMNPVVASNLAIAAFHAVTLVLLWRAR